MAARLGADGLMVLPPMVYSGKDREIVEHFRKVAAATDLPIMLYNNPPAYRTDVTPRMLAALADVDTIVAFKEASGDTRRIVDIRNLTGARALLEEARTTGPTVNVAAVDLAALIDAIDARLADLADHPSGPTLGPPDLRRSVP